MPYTPNPLDPTTPLDPEIAKTAAAEFRSIKAYIGKIPVNIQAANYTIVPADAGKQIRHPSTDVSARSWTLQSNATSAWQEGTVVTLVNKNGAGPISIIPTDTMRLAGAGTTGARTLAANGVATLLWDAVALEWMIDGTGVS